MLKILLSSAAVLGFTTLAQAAIVVQYDALPANGSYFAPTAAYSTPLYEPNVTGSTPNRTSPFSNNATPYDAVEVGGSAAFGNVLFELERSVAYKVAATSTSTFGSGDNSFRFVWGTPDTYNRLSFYEGGFNPLDPTQNLIGSVNGINDGVNNYLATVTGMGTYDAVVFSTGSQNAFEFAGVSAVPLPASAPMFGAALMALGTLGYGLKRNKAAAAA